MQNKIFALLLSGFVFAFLPNMARAEDEVLMDEEITYAEEDDEGAADVADAASASAVADYKVDGSVFQMITDLEQQKVLLELEKERAQLDLDMDRLAAEKIKLQMEMDTLSGRAEQEQQVLQNEKAKLEAEAQRIEQEKRALAEAAAAPAPDVNTVSAPKKGAKKSSDAEEDITAMYKLVNVMGAGDNLQATLSDIATGQTKRVNVGKVVNGFTVKSISLDEGVVFAKDGETQNLNISSR